MTTNNTISGKSESYVDEDLMQAIKMNVFISLSNLRKNLIRHLDMDDDFEINIE